MTAKTPSISELNQLGVFSGKISEIQAKTMDSYPFIFFNGVKVAKLDYDIQKTKDETSYIHYDLTLDQENDHLPKRFKALESAVKFLFWKEMVLKLSINGEEYVNE